MFIYRTPKQRERASKNRREAGTGNRRVRWAGQGCRERGRGEEGESERDIKRPRQGERARVKEREWLMFVCVHIKYVYTDG